MTHRDLKALQNSPRDDQTSGGVSQGGESMAGFKVSDEELIEARERMDAGLGRAFPQLLERLADGGDEAVCDKHAIDHETASAVGRELLNARQAIFNAAKALPLKPQTDLHLAFNGLINEIDRLAGEVAERWGE